MAGAKIFYERPSNTLIKPGRSAVHVTFTITEEELNEIKAYVAEHGKMNFEKKVEVLDEDDQLIALVTKVIYIAKKEGKSKVSK